MNNNILKDYVTKHERLAPLLDKENFNFYYSIALAILFAIGFFAVQSSVNNEIEAMPVAQEHQEVQVLVFDRNHQAVQIKGTIKDGVVQVHLNGK